MKKSIIASLLSVVMLNGMVVFAQTTGAGSPATPQAATVTGQTTTGTLGDNLSSANKDVEQQIRALRQEMEAKIKAIRQEYQTKIDAIRQAAKDKNSQIRQQFKAKQDEMKAQKQQMRQKEKEMRDQRKKNNQNGTSTKSTSTPPATNQ